jgi:hypothetical protein
MSYAGYTKTAYNSLIFSILHILPLIPKFYHLSQLFTDHVVFRKMLIFNELDSTDYQRVMPVPKNSSKIVW